MAAGGAESRLPIVIRRKRGRLFWRILQAVVLALYVLTIFGSRNDPLDEPLLVAAGIAAGLILVLELIARWRGRVRDRTFEIDAEGVCYRTGRETWTEPLEAYDGVLWREETRTSAITGGGSSSHTVWFLELKHRDDPTRTVPILEMRSEEGVRARWEAVARGLDLPALRELDHGETMRREPGELDAPLRDFAAEGRLEGALRGDEAPPEGVEWNPREPRRARVRQRLGGIFLLSFIPVLGGIYAFFGFDQQLPLLLLAAPLVAHFHRTHAHYRIDVADNRLLLSLNLGGVRLSRRSLPLEEIEQVWIKPVRLGVVETADRTVVIETDRRTASLSLLSPAAGAWVAGHIRRIAAAPPGAA